MKTFKAFRLDTANHCLWRDEDRVPLSPRGYDVLAYLVEHAGQVVAQEKLIEALWVDTHVNPEILRKYILEIRKALGDRPDEPEFIETLPKRGYRFVAKVQVEGAAQPPAAAAPAPLEQQATLDSIRLKETRPDSRGLLGIAITSIALILVVAVAAGYFFFEHSRAGAASVSHTSIAVLPFADMSATRDQEYFSDGLTEQLINDLAKVPGLKVMGRSSAFQFKGRDEDLRTVGRELGVANILEGSVQKDGNRVRITVALIQVDDGFQLWSETYDRQLSHIFATQDEIARSVSGALQMKLLPSGDSPTASARRSANPDAYQAYLEGQYFFVRGQDEQDLKQALFYSDQAIKLDANYASAWAQRSKILRTMASLVLIDNNEGFRSARESAEKAIAFDPDLAAGYLAMATVQIDHDWDWEDADTSLKKAAMLEPGNVEVLSERAMLAASTGHLDESIELYRQALALDPLRPDLHFWLAYYLYFSGRYGEALTELKVAEELNPAFTGLHAIRGRILLAEGHQQEALDEIEKETTEWEKLSGESLFYAAVGRRDKSDRALDRLIATHQNDCAYQVAEVYASRKETDKAFEWLDRAYRQRDPGVAELKINPLMKSVRQDPRYAALLKKMLLLD